MVQRVRVREGIERVRVEYEPQWDASDPRDSFRRFARKLVGRNAWRVSPEFDVEDLMQEAYVVFLVVQRRYPQVVERKHFMALFHVSLRNTIHKLATKRTQRVDRVQAEPDEAGRTVFDVLVERSDFLAELEVRMLLADAPEPVRIVVERLLETEERPPYLVVNGVRETSRQFMARLADVPEFVDIPKMLTDWACGVRASSV